MQQRFAPLSDMVNLREATEGEREWLWCKTAMRTKPAPSSCPEALHRSDMPCTNPVALFISGLRTSPMLDTRMAVSPGTQAAREALCLRVHKRTPSHGRCDERLAGLVLHMGSQRDDHWTATLDHATDGWPVLRQWTTTTLPLAAASTSWTSRTLHHLRPALMAGHPRGFVALALVGPRHGGLFCTIPSRRGVVLCWTARPWTAHACAMCSFARCSPMPYRHHPHPLRG